MAFWHNIQNTKYCYLIGKCQNRKITLTRFGYSDDMPVKSKDGGWRECGMSRQQTTKFHRQNHESDMARPSCMLLRQRRAERNLEDDVEDDDDTTIRHLRLTVAVPSRQVNTSAAAASEATPVRHGHGGSVGHIAHRVSRGRRRASSAVRVRRREASGCDDASSNTSFYITFSLFLLALGVGFGWTFNHYTIDIFGRFPFFVWLYCGTLYSVPCQTFVSLYMYISLILY